MSPQRLAALLRLLAAMRRVQGDIHAASALQYSAGGVLRLTPGEIALARLQTTEDACVTS